MEQQKYKKWEGHHLRMNKKKEKKNLEIVRFSLGWGEGFYKDILPLAMNYIEVRFYWENNHKK